MLGVLSLIFWSLILVVTLKYVVFIMRADNRGEGGIMALIALAPQAARPAARGSALIIILGLVGAALFYGDGVITPAISVLSAVEGLEVATPALEPVRRAARGRRAGRRCSWSSAAARRASGGCSGR